MTLGSQLTTFVKQHKLGRVYAAETGFVIARNPDTVRAPDVAFVRSERVPPPPPRGFFAGAPDLAVEVLSPDDRAGAVLAQVGDWLAAGTVQVWVVDPRSQTITVYSADPTPRVFTAAEHLPGGDLLPGFDLVVGQVFE